MPGLISGTRPPRLFWGGVALGALVLTGSLAVAGREGWPGSSALLLFAAAGPLMAAVDWKERRLPDVITLPLALACTLCLAVCAWLQEEWTRFGTALGCALGAALFFFALVLIAPGHMGLGDAKLMLSAGVVLGWYGPLATMGGITVGLVLGLVWGGVQICRGKATKGSHIALGPWLISGTLLVGAVLY